MASNTIKGYAAASLASLIIGFSFLFVKLALGEHGPLAILADRFTIAFATMLPFAFFKTKLVHFSYKKVALFLPIATLYPILFFSLQAMGLNQAITSSEAGVIQSTTPIFILVLALVFLQEKITLAQFFCTLLSVLGVMLIVFAKGVAIEFGHAKGLLLIGGSVLAGAVNNILIRKYRADFTTFEVTFMSTLLGFVVFNGLHIANCVITETPYFFFIQSGSTKYIVALVYLGVLSSLCSSLLTNYALAKIESAKVGVFGNLVIVFAIIGGVVFMDERLTWLQLMGAAMILAGVAGANIYSYKKNTG